MRRMIVVASALAALAFGLPARGAYIVAGVAADRNAFVGLLNNESQGGTWGLNAMNQLVFTANANPINFFATRLNAFNNGANRTVQVGNNLGGVLVGAFLGGGVQSIDLADVVAFSANAAAQPQPLLDTRGSVLIHELGELFIDGALANFPNAHRRGGIVEQNRQLTAQGVRGMRRPGPDTFRLIGAPVAGVQVFEVRVPFITTAMVPAGGGNPALAAGRPYFEVIRGRITGGPNFAITNIRRGLVDLGVAYDDTEFDVAIDSVFAQVIPEPGSGLLLVLGLVPMVVVVRRRGGGRARSRAA